MTSEVLKFINNENCLPKINNYSKKFHQQLELFNR